MTTAQNRPLYALTRTPGERSVSLYATPRRVAAGVLALQLLVLVLVFGPFAGAVGSLVRAAVTFVYLSVVPGYLTLRVLGIEPTERLDTLLFSVGLSLSVLMAVGTFFNFVLRFLGVARPMSTVPMVLAIGAFVVVLTGVYLRRAEPTVTSLSLDLDVAFSPLVLGLLLLPFLGIFGAHLLNGWDENRLLLLLYALIAIIALAVAFRRFPSRLLPLAVWVISVSLLLQNTLTGHYLAWGDQPKEALLAFTVLQEGYWQPDFAPAFESKFSMLRIVILHPVYKLFTDLSLFWLFRAGHPLLFSMAPVALYQTYKHFNTRRLAFLSAFLFMSLFSFFIVLSRNTRTATALLFLALLALVIADNELSRVHRKGLAIAFAASIIVSHYGVSYMVMLSLVLVAGLVVVARRVPNGHVRGQSTMPIVAVTSLVFVTLYFSIALGWYLYGSPEGKTFSLLVGFTDHFVSSMSEDYMSPESSASLHIVAQEWQSSTLQLLKYYNVFIGGIIGIGVLSTVWDLYTGRIRSQISVEYVAFAVVFFLVFMVTFLPVERFNTARTYPTSLVFFAPFFLYGLAVWSRAVGYIKQVEISPLRVQQIAAVLIIGYFAFNVGLVSVTITDQYGPNALVEKERIVMSGHPEEQAYFYKQHPTEYDISGSIWLKTQVTPNAVVHTSGWPGNPTFPIGQPEYESIIQRTVSTDARTIELNSNLEEGYVYLGSLSTLGNTVILPSGHFDFDQTSTESLREALMAESRIYANGANEIYH